MTELQDFLDIGIEVKPGRVEQKVTCPKCSPERKNKQDKCLSVNLDKGVYNCHHCGWSGNVKLKERKEYFKPAPIEINLSERILKYFQIRGISNATIANWKIGESREYFPQIRAERAAINFNYYREGELVNVKYRDAEKNFKLVSGAELIFYGLDNIKESNHCYIVEGEMDSLSLYEAGLYAVVSVPNGASKGNQRLDYLDNCFKYFEDKESIVLCTDNDEAGLSLRNELARRLGKHRCKYVDFGDFKDANEVLVSKGSETLRSIIKKAKNFPIEGVVNIEDIWDSVLSFNSNGFEQYSLGLGSSDEYLKLQLGEWSICTGVPNSGKSDIIDQICVNMTLKYNFRVAMFAPESFPYEGHIKRIANKINQTECNNDQLNQSKNFIKEHFYFVKIDLENLSLEAILNKFRELVLQKGINLCVIDPWNTLDHSEQKDLAYVGKKLSELTQFVQQTNTHLFLVAHPRKMESIDGKYRIPTPYDISGSSDFFNKAFNCITVYRNNQKKNKKLGSDVVEVHIQKVKRKENGMQGSFDLAPDFKNGGFYVGQDELDDLPF
jgi:twinkle protein